MSRKDTKIQQLKTFTLSELNAEISDGDVASKAQLDAVDAKFKPYNFTATAAPGVNNDANDTGASDGVGYQVGSKWLNTSTSEWYMCVDSTPGAAVWQQLSLTPDELAAVAITGYFDDLIYKAEQTLTYGATIPWDMSNGLCAKVTMTGNGTLQITNPVAGSTGVLKVIQDLNGSRTLALPANSKAPGGAISWSTAAYAVDTLAYYYDGTDFWWNTGNNWKTIT